MSKRSNPSDHDDHKHKKHKSSRDDNDDSESSSDDGSSYYEFYVSTDSGEPSSDESDKDQVDNPLPGPSSVQCSSCSSRFSEQQDLDNHVRNVHPHKLPSSCETCGYQASTIYGRMNLFFSI